jgi:hypothetical protein
MLDLLKFIQFGLLVGGQALFLTCIQQSADAFLRGWRWTERQNFIM